MKKVIILKGLPASGKSTWAKNFVKNNKGYARVNKDDLRKMAHNEIWSKTNERVIVEMRNAIVNHLLSINVNIIVDDTNFIKDHEEAITRIAQQWQADVEVKFFDVALEECLTRNAARTGNDKVPENVIIDMYNKFVAPTKQKIIQNLSLPKTIIVDLDGTIAIHVNRSPFEFMRCDEDVVNVSVLNCVNAMKDRGYKIIFVSGREDVCRDKSVSWIKEKCGITEFQLFMRKTGDNRKDSIVKEEIYKNDIIPFYYVEFVLDDRKQVVDHLRELGMTVFQVAPGNF